MSENESDDTRKVSLFEINSQVNIFKLFLNIFQIQDEDFAQHLKLETCTEDINEIIGNQKALETLKERYI